MVPIYYKRRELASSKEAGVAMATRTRSAIVLVALTLLLVVPCTGGCRSGPPLKVKIAVYPGEMSAPIAVAQEKGLFRSNGLEVTTDSYDSGALAVKALLAGEADVATASDYVFASSAFSSPDLRLLAEIDWASNMWFVTTRDKGVSEEADLPGRTVGVPPGTSAEYALGGALSSEGLSRESVAVAYMAPDELSDALASGRVDAVVIWDPVANDIREEIGDDSLGWVAQGSHHYHRTLISKASILERKPEMSERLMRSTVEADRYIREHPNGAKSIVSRSYDLDRAYIDYAWPLNRFETTLDQCLLFDLDMQGRWFSDTKRAGRDVPNYLELIDFKGLELADPEAVRVAY